MVYKNTPAYANKVTYALITIFSFVGLVTLALTLQSNFNAEVKSATGFAINLSQTVPSTSMPIAVGSTVRVATTVSIGNADEYTANVASLVLRFNPQVLRVERIVDDSNNVIALYDAQSLDNTSGRVVVDVANLGGKNFSNAEELLQVEFKVLSAAAGTTEVKVESLSQLGVPDYLQGQGYGSLIINFAGDGTQPTNPHALLLSRETTGPVITNSLFNVMLKPRTNQAAPGTAAVAELEVRFDNSLMEVLGFTVQSGVIALRGDIATANASGVFTLDVAKEGGQNFASEETLVTLNMRARQINSVIDSVVQVADTSTLGFPSLLTAGSFGSVTIPLQPQREPFGGAQWLIPGLVEAENFDEGGQGLTYYARSPRISGAVYRSNVGIDIVPHPQDGGFLLGPTEPTEWVEYSVNVSKADNYEFQVVQWQSKGSALDVFVDAVKIGTVRVKNNANSDRQYPTLFNVPLTAGAHIIRLENSGSVDSQLNYFKVGDLTIGCRGDYDATGNVDVVDLQDFATNYKSEIPNCDVDIVDGDTEQCVLNAADLLQFAIVYKQSKCKM